MAYGRIITTVSKRRPQIPFIHRVGKPRLASMPSCCSRISGKLFFPAWRTLSRLRRARKVLPNPQRCFHSGPDCQGPLQTEHITYAPDTTAPICAFHNQVLRVMRLSLALSKSAVALRGKLTVGQRTKTIEVLKRHRFDHASVERTDAYCKELATKQGIVLGKLDCKKHRTTPTRPDPVDGIRFRMSFKPEIKCGLVTCCKWDVRLL